MIKVGIYGPDAINSPVRKQLLRLLLRHPDVDLRAVASPAGNTVAIADLHPVYAGETDLTLERVLNIDGLDVLFVIDEENLTDEILSRRAADPEFSVIVLGKAPHCRVQALAGGEGAPIYGLPELNRKALVRGARYAVSPRPEVMIIELALLPLAKNGLLNAPVNVSINTAFPLDEVKAEVQTLLQSVQPSTRAEMSITAAEPAPYERVDLHATMDTPIAIEEIDRLYREAYEDHNFVYILNGIGPVDEDLRGSNKCLLRLSKEGDTLAIDASMDALTKGITGNAVHLMNLIFGLHERTGLSI